MSTSTGHDDQGAGPGAAAYGIALFAGTVLTTVGLFQFLEGLSAVLDDQLFLTTPDYLYSIDLTGWGWIHMTLGAIAVGVGIAVLYGRTWARVAGILIAALSAVANFAYLPYYPVWSMLVIMIDVLAIWALASLVRDSSSTVTARDAGGDHPPVTRAG